MGNPPFVGGKFLRRELGNNAVEDIFKVYEGRVKAESDLVVYWFEKARAQLKLGLAKRVGLLATQGIRGGANSNALKRILLDGRIFWAWSDRPWLLEGAAVRVCMVGFDLDDGDDCALDGHPVAAISASLNADVDFTKAVRLKENQGLSYMGTSKVGDFDLDPETARKILNAPVNPNGRPNTDVVRPWFNSLDVTRRPRGMYVIDFDPGMSEKDAALYELPFQYIRKHVFPARSKNRRAAYAIRWWCHAEPRTEMRRSLAALTRYIATPSLSKHRIFVFLPVGILPDHQLFAFPREDDYFLGVLHSKLHELWALQLGTQLEDRPRYTPTSTFDTFPFPLAAGQRAV